MVLVFIVLFQLVSAISKNQLINYFSRYPIYSYKYLNYVDWVEVINMIGDSSLSVESRADRFNSIVARFNTKRTVFSWNHLDSFYSL